tara:strand:- start:1373 stop:1723 length:351 start_codon:yes stop_codon:yes gene_type:complete
MKNSINKKTILNFNTKFEQIVDVVSEKYWDTIPSEQQANWGTIDTFDFTINYLKNNGCDVVVDDGLYHMWSYMLDANLEVDVEETLKGVYFNEDNNEERTTQIMNWVNNILNFEVK